VIGSNFMDIISDKTDVLKILPEAAEELCSALFRNSPAGIYITRNGKFIYTNIEFRHVTGYSQDELYGKDYRRLINPRYRQKPKQNIASLFAEDDEASHEFKITTRDSKKRWVSEKITYFKYGGNWLTLGHWLDISEHHAVENAWREAERRFQSAFEDLSSGLTIISTDGIFLKANKSFYDMIGYEEKEVLESRFDEVLHPDDRRACSDLMQLFVSLEKPEVPVKKRLLCKDGRTVWVAMSISLIGDSQEDPSYFMVHFQDITEQKRVEEGLKEEDQLYHSLINTSLEPIAVLDLDLHVTHVSQKFLSMLAYVKNSDLLGKKIGGFIIPGERDKGEIQILEMIIQGIPGKLECGLLKNDGGTLPVEMNISWINNDKGTPMCVVCSLRDQSEQKQADAVAREVMSQASTALQSTATAILILNEDTTIAMVNAAFEKMTGYTREEIEGKKSWIEFVAREDQARLKRYYLMRRLDPGSAPDTYQFKLTDRQGNVKNVLINVSPIPGANKTVAALLEQNGFQVVDIEKYEQEKRALRESEERCHLLADNVKDAQENLSKLEKTVNGTIEAMARIEEMRDPYTSGHQERIAMLVGAIAREMGLPDDQVKGIVFAARIHDIGKVYVPMEILGKPGKLNEIEWQIIRTHAEGSYNVLKSIEFRWPIAEAVLQHHERLDGSGYPKGLTGKDIILEAKILMVADVVEAMASYRPYRPSMGIEAALEEIGRNSGVLYDVDVVKTCIKLFREKGFSFERAAGDF